MVRFNDCTMGSCFSCCRRRKTGEKEPLLPLHQSIEDTRPSYDHIQKSAQVLAAISTGKLPSQEQINKALQILLQSNFLNDKDDGGYSPLSARGREILNDVEEVAHAVMRFGLEKNSMFTSGLSWNVWC